MNTTTTNTTLHLYYREQDKWTYCVFIGVHGVSLCIHILFLILTIKWRHWQPLKNRESMPYFNASVKILFDVLAMATYIVLFLFEVQVVALPADKDYISFTYSLAFLIFILPCGTIVFSHFIGQYLKFVFGSIISYLPQESKVTAKSFALYRYLSRPNKYVDAIVILLEVLITWMLSGVVIAIDRIVYSSDDIENTLNNSAQIYAFLLNLSALTVAVYAFLDVLPLCCKREQARVWCSARRDPYRMRSHFAIFYAFNFVMLLLSIVVAIVTFGESIIAYNYVVSVLTFAYMFGDTMVQIGTLFIMSTCYHRVVPSNAQVRFMLEHQTPMMKRMAEGECLVDYIDCWLSLEQAHRNGEDTRAILEKYKNVFVAVSLPSKELTEKIRHQQALVDADIVSVQAVLETCLADVASQCQQIRDTYVEHRSDVELTQK